MRDNQSYKTIEIGKQTWMAQNLNFESADSWCYDDSSFNCDRYGRLYTWEAALKACPENWHLPGDEEWAILEQYLGMTPEEVKIWLMRGNGEGTMLKNESEWEMENGEKQGYNSSGFDALPAGFLNVHNGKYTDLGKRASWWSSTPSDQYAIRRTLFYGKTGIDKDPATRTLGFSVRCIQNISDLRILTYNVWYGFTEVPERKPLWISWMKTQNADIVFLQELNEYTSEQLKEDAFSWGHPYSVLLKEDGFPTGMTSRFPIEDVQRYTAGFHHGLIRAKVKGIYYYTIHLHPSNWEFRKREMDLILEDIQNLPANSHIVLAGDFNTFSSLDSSYYSHDLLVPFFGQRDEAYNEHNLNGGELDYTVLQKLMEAGFTDLEYKMRGDDYTFSGSFPTLIEKPGDHGSKRRLDYIFASEGLIPYVHQASVLATDTTLFLSDHLPVIADFKIE